MSGSCNWRVRNDVKLQIQDATAWAKRMGRGGKERTGQKNETYEQPLESSDE